MTHFCVRVAPCRAAARQPQLCSACLRSSGTRAFPVSTQVHSLLFRLLLGQEGRTSVARHNVSMSTPVICTSNLRYLHPLTAIIASRLGRQCWLLRLNKACRAMRSHGRPVLALLGGKVFLRLLFFVRGERRTECSAIGALSE